MNKGLLVNKKGNTFSKVVADLAGLDRVHAWEPELWDMDTLFNWGCSTVPLVKDIGRILGTRKMFNAPAAVGRAVNKRATFEFCKQAGMCTMPFTTSDSVARNWYEEGRTVYCRVLSSASGAKGLVVANKERGVSMSKSSLYTRFCKPTYECRVFADIHGSDPLVLIKKRMGAEKLRDIGLEKANYWIRNLKNGWVFLLPNEEEARRSPELGEHAKQYLRALYLDYGAVDLSVVLPETSAEPVKVRLIEVNTAPGIQREETKEWVKNSFERMMNL